MTQPYPADSGQPGPPPQHYIVQHVQPQASNGLGTAGFVLGLLGVIFAWIPLIGVIAWFLVLPGAVLSAVGIGKANRGEATNKGLAIAGLVLSIIGLAICIAYVVLLGVIGAAAGSSGYYP